MKNSEISILIGRLKTVKKLSEDKNIEELSSILIEALKIINKEEAGFKV